MQSIVKNTADHQYLGQQIRIIPVPSINGWNLRVKINQSLEWLDRDNVFGNLDELIAEGLFRGRQLIDNRW